MPERDERLVRELIDLVNRWQEGNGSMLADIASETRNHRAVLSELQKDTALARKEVETLNASLMSLRQKFEQCFEHRQERYDQIAAAAEKKLDAWVADFKKFKDTEFADIRNKVLKYSGAIALAAGCVGYIVSHFWKHP